MLQFNIKWVEIKQFLAMPAAKQVVGILIVVIIGMAMIGGTVILHLDSRATNSEKKLTDCEKDCGNEKLVIQKEYSDSVKVLLQGFEKEKSSIYRAAIAKLEDKERTLDEALAEARNVIATQNRTKTKLQKITTKVSKIVTDENK